MTASRQRLFPDFGFGLACLVGLCGAFVGVLVTSFTLDEIITQWIVSGGGFGAFVSRMLVDVHPPLYYVAAYGVSRVFGTSDLVLRLFSGVLAVGAILLFIGLRKAFSLSGRLFASAIAVASSFWIWQSQNARDYALSMLIGVVLLAICIRILNAASEAERSRTIVTMLAPIALLGSFVHFYLMYECLAVFMILGVFFPRQRLLLGGLFVAVLGLAGLYVKLVISRFAQYSLTEAWIPNTFKWTSGQLVVAVGQTFNWLTLAAVVLCAALVIWRWGWAAASRRPLERAPYLGREPLLGDIDVPLLLCLGVPVIVTLGGVASSTVLSPNLTFRNLLVASPFLWGLFARLYDLGPGAMQGRARVFVDGLCVAALLAASMAVTSRFVPHFAPLRESAEWVRRTPGCAGQRIPVINMDKIAWAKPAFAETLIDAGYSHYLEGFASPAMVFREDLAAGRIDAPLRGEIEARLRGSGCPIVGWVIHGVNEAGARSIARDLEKLAPEGGARPIRIQPFAVYDRGLTSTLQPPNGFVFHVQN